MYMYMYMQIITKIWLVLITCNKYSQCRRCCNSTLSILGQPVDSFTTNGSWISLKVTSSWVEDAVPIPSDSVSWITWSGFKQMKSLKEPVRSPMVLMKFHQKLHLYAHVWTHLMYMYMYMCLTSFCTTENCIHVLLQLSNLYMMLQEM